MTTLQIPFSTVLLATHNAGKVRELTQMLTPFNIHVVAQSDFPMTPVEETGLSFVENALLKARHGAKHTSLPTLADDSGLEVDALNGAPGIYSARYAYQDANDSANCKKLLGDLAAVPEEERTARFHCVLVFLRHALDPSPKIFQGTWEGKILLEPQGENGFGYDPLFFVPTHQCSAAQLSAEIKNTISHRAQAFKKFVEYLQGNSQ